VGKAQINTKTHITVEEVVAVVAADTVMVVTEDILLLTIINKETHTYL